MAEKNSKGYSEYLIGSMILAPLYVYEAAHTPNKFGPVTALALLLSSFVTPRYSSYSEEQAVESNLLIATEMNCTGLPGHNCTSVTVHLE